MPRIISSLKYQLRSLITPALIICGVFLTLGIILAFFFPAEKIFTPIVLVIPSLCLALILGSRLFSGSFNFLTANNISRRQFFASSLLAIFSLATVTAITNAILFESSLYPLQKLSGIFGPLYGKSNFLCYTLWWFFLINLLLLISLLLIIIFFRINLALRGLLALMPLLIVKSIMYLNKLFGGLIKRLIVQGFKHFLAILTKPNPLLAIVNMFLANLVIILLLWLPLRRLTPQSFDKQI